MFGAPCEFKDRNVADAKDGYIECTSYKDKTYDLKKIELDKGTQVSLLFSSLYTKTINSNGRISFFFAVTFKIKTMTFSYICGVLFYFLFSTFFRT